jgi:hypothetical protein
VTTSARADATNSAAATMPGSKVADAVKLDFIRRLPYVPVVIRRRARSRADVKTERRLV